MQRPQQLKKRPVSLEKMPQFRPKGTGDKDQFTVRHAAELRLDLGDGVFRGIPAKGTATSSQGPLRELLSKAKLPDLWANNVLFRRHLPKSEVDRTRKKQLNSSNSGRSTVRG